MSRTYGVATLAKDQRVDTPLFFALFALYFGLWFASLSAQTLWLKIILGVMPGHAIGTLFVVCMTQRVDH
jgi:hypothetical protein